MYAVELQSDSSLAEMIINPQHVLRAYSPDHCVMFEDTKEEMEPEEIANLPLQEGDLPEFTPDGRRLLHYWVIHVFMTNDQCLFLHFYYPHHASDFYHTLQNSFHHRP